MVRRLALPVWDALSSEPPSCLCITNLFPKPPYPTPLLINNIMQAS